MIKNLDLADRLKQQLAKENEIFLDLTRKQLKTSREELNNILGQELNTIKADIKRQLRHISWTGVGIRVLIPMLIGLALSTGIFTGSWATMRYYSDQIVTMQANLDKLQRKGGKIEFSTCNSDGQTRLCIRINESRGRFIGTKNKKIVWMVPEGY